MEGRCCIAGLAAGDTVRGLGLTVGFGDTMTDRGNSGFDGGG